MKKILVILLLIPILGFNQYNTKYYTKKQEINGFQQYADSITRILNAEIERLLENKETHQIEIDKLYQQQSKIQLASKYLKKAKRRRAIGIIVSGVTVLTAVIGFQVANAPSKNGGFQLDFSQIYLAAAAVVVFIGQAINIPLQISSKENIRMAKDLIREVDNINYNSQSLVN